LEGLAVHLQSEVWAMALEMDEEQFHVSNQEFIVDFCSQKSN
jgi:hypothetical protein